MCAVCRDKYQNDDFTIFEFALSACKPQRECGRGAFAHRVRGGCAGGSFVACHTASVVCCLVATYMHSVKVFVLVVSTCGLGPGEREGQVQDSNKCPTVFVQ